MLVVLVRMLGRARRDLLVRLVVHPSTGGANLRRAEWVSGGTARVHERSRTGEDSSRVAEALIVEFLYASLGVDAVGGQACCANSRRMVGERRGDVCGK